MSKFDLALKLADELGTTTDEALTMIDEVGESSARKWLTGGVLAGAGTGGVLLSSYINDKSDEAALAKYESIQDIINASDLTPEQKAQYLNRIQSDDSGHDDSKGGLDVTQMVMDDPAKVVILVIIVLAVLNNGLDNLMGSE